MKELLELIENASPDDSDKLDEIDALTHGLVSSLRSHYPSFATMGRPRYTRSRDALKAIRPEGWDYDISGFDFGHVTVKYFFGHDAAKEILSPALPTEELAELHAIIQAIEWEKKNPLPK